MNIIVFVVYVCDICFDVINGSVVVWMFLMDVYDIVLQLKC